MTSVQIGRRTAAAVVGGGVVWNTIWRYGNESKKQVVCETNKNNVSNESMTFLEMQKQQQRIGRKLYSGEGDSKEEQELLSLLDSVEAGDLSVEDGIEKVRQAMFGKYKQIYATHVCGSFLEGWHTCFFDKMVEKKKSGSNDDNIPFNNENESSHGNKNILLDCKDPFLLALQSCMYQQTEKVKEIIKAKMGDEAYEKWYEESKRKTLRKLIAASSTRDPKEIEEAEVDKLYEESMKNRLQLEEELKAFEKRQGQQKEQPNQKSEKDTNSSKPWWKLGR